MFWFRGLDSTSRSRARRQVIAFGYCRFGRLYGSFERQGHGEARSLARGAFHGDVTAERTGELPADGEPQSGAAELARRAVVHLTERFED